MFLLHRKWRPFKAFLHTWHPSTGQEKRSTIQTWSISQQLDENSSLKDETRRSHRTNCACNSVTHRITSRAYICSRCAIKDRFDKWTSHFKFWWGRRSATNRKNTMWRRSIAKKMSSSHEAMIFHASLKFPSTSLKGLVSKNGGCRCTTSGILRERC